MNIIEWAFGKRPTHQELLRKNQRTLDKAIRELDRERAKLEAQEKKLEADIKISAKNGQHGALRIQARDLLRTRRNVEKFYDMRTKMQGISLRIQSYRGNDQMAQAMKGATSVLGSMNRQMNLPELQKIASQFEREADLMDQRQEMMDDALDDMMEGDDQEEEEDNLVQRVLEEMGLEVGSQLSQVPQAPFPELNTAQLNQPLGVSEGFSNAVPNSTSAPAKGDNKAADVDPDNLEARLRNLGGGR